MRKVFISSVMIQTIKPEDAAVFQSRDFDLGDEQHFAPISYLMDMNIEEGDDVLVITGVTDNELPRKNYALLKADMEKILEKHHAKAEFVVADEPDATKERDKMDALTFSKFFKDIADCLKDGDKIYADMTFGMKCYTIGMFIAMMYAVKACHDVDVEQMVYAQRYSGKKDDPASKPTSDIIDISSLFYISTIVSNAKPGEKKGMDEFLKFMIG